MSTLILVAMDRASLHPAPATIRPVSYTHLNLSVLGNFIGMLTDSRSLLSYARHEYFRRVLCALLGRWVENGEDPRDMPALGKLVQDICFNNAKRYFNL